MTKHFATSADVTHEITRVGPNHTLVSKCGTLIPVSAVRAVAFLDKRSIQRTWPGEPCKKCFWRHDKDKHG